MKAGKTTAENALEGRMHDQAAAWIARLRADDAGERDYREFALWLAANPEHRDAMDSMLELWDDLAVSRHLPLAEAPAEITNPGRRRWLGSGLAVAACALFVLFLLPRMSLDDTPLRYQTGIGERLEVDLADGSSITLNTNSRLEVNLGESTRHITLLDGEAYFQVERDVKRPFVVDAGAAEVRVMGTAFNVHLHGGQSDITVTRGVVRVTERGNTGNRAPATELLYANQSVSASSSGLARPARVEAVTEVAWREGRLVADSMPLATLVDEIARYHEVKILIAEPALAQRTVSGVFQLDSPDTILRALEHSFEIHSMVLEDSSILLISDPR